MVQTVPHSCGERRSQLIGILILNSNPIFTAPRITLGLRGYGLRVAATLPVAGEPFSPALRGFISSIGTTPTTFGSFTPSFSTIFKMTACGSRGTGTIIPYLERGRTRAQWCVPNANNPVGCDAKHLLGSSVVGPDPAWYL